MSRKRAISRVTSLWVLKHDFPGGHQAPAKHRKKLWTRECYMAFYELNSLSHKKERIIRTLGEVGLTKFCFRRNRYYAFGVWNVFVSIKLYYLRCTYIRISQFNGWRGKSVTLREEPNLFFFSLHFLECMNTSIAASRGIPGDPSVHRGGPAPARIRMKETCFISVYDSGAAASNGH